MNKYHVVYQTLPPAEGMFVYQITTRTHTHPYMPRRKLYDIK